MKKIILRVLVVVALAVAGAAAFAQFKFSHAASAQFQATEFSIREQVATADVELGKRLYSVRTGCVDCHGEDLSGNLIMESGAMGTVHGANLTPFNLSSWSDEEIARAIRYGIHKTGRSLQFMPSFDYQSLSLGDVAALVAFLRSVPPVERPGHVNAFGPVAKLLSLLGQMPILFPAAHMDLNQGFGEKPAEGPTPEFGKYLAQACAGCHGHEFHGGKIPGGDPSWPEASNIRLGSNPVWTEASFRETIMSGVSPISGAKLRPPMPAAILARMNETEIKAMWLFLSSLK